VVSMFNEARMGRAVDSVGLQSLVEEISDSVTRNPGALISLARLKTADDYTYMHSVAVCALMVALAKQLKLRKTSSAAPAWPACCMTWARPPFRCPCSTSRASSPTASSPWSQPPGGGLHMLKEGGNVPEGRCWTPACTTTKKWMDRATPTSCKGDGISVIARMTAICDVYDAITSDRPYKRGWDPAESLRRMAEWTKDHFDPRLFQAFVKSIGIYPVGSLVRLTSGRMGVVTEQAPAALTTPRRQGVLLHQIRPAHSPRTGEPGRTRLHRENRGARRPRQMEFPDLNELWSGFSEQVW
jgi:hypothetical protein